MGEEPIYQTSYMGFWIKVYPNRVDFKSGVGTQSIPLNQIVSIQPGTMGILQITLESTGGMKYAIPTTKKKEVQQAIIDAQARFAANGQIQTNVANMSGMIPIDEYLARLKTQKDNWQLELDKVNTQMSTIRAHYEQSRSNLFFKQSAHSKDHQLKKLQPTKEKLQQEILAIRTEITRIQALKRQGVKMVKPEY
jgi:hypothetical protein